MSLKDRIERERRHQNLYRRIRKVLRYVAILSGASGIGLVVTGLSDRFKLIIPITLMLFAIALLSALALFVFGGFAPLWMRGGLSDRERDVLDR